MTNSRRIFCKNSVYISLGLSFFPWITQAKAHDTVSKKVLNLTKKAQKVIKVSGQIRYEDLSPVQHATLEIWHNNSESNPSKFGYKGKLITDSEGNYQFETDFPEKHFEEGNYKMRRIFFKIKPENGEETLTKLFFGMNEKAFIDNHHFGKTHKDFREELPKTKDENENLKSIQFNIYLNF